MIEFPLFLTIFCFFPVLHYALYFFPLPLSVETSRLRSLKFQNDKAVDQRLIQRLLPVRAV